MKEKKKKKVAAISGTGCVLVRSTGFGLHFNRYYPYAIALLFLRLVLDRNNKEKQHYVSQAVTKVFPKGRHNLTQIIQNSKAAHNHSKQILAVTGLYQQCLNN
jgi:hypothetical protein